MQRCSSALGHSSRAAFHSPGAPSATISAGARSPRSMQVAAEGEPVLVALAAAQRQPEQHLAALQRDAPGDQHALGRLVVGAQLQIQRVQEQVDEVVLVEPALAPAPVALARVLADPRDGRLADHRLVEGLLQRGLDVAHRQPAQERADDQRLQRVRARHVPAEDPALEPQLARVAHARALELDRPARSSPPAAAHSRCGGSPARSARS